MKKVKAPELVLLFSEYLLRVDTWNFSEGTVSDQFRYFNFSSYLVIFRADQSKKTPCIFNSKVLGSTIGAIS